MVLSIWLIRSISPSKMIIAHPSIHRLIQSILNVDHSILIKLSEMYGFNNTNLVWFVSYLNGRKQYINITESPDIVKKDIKCAVPHDSNLGLLLFLLFANNIPNSSNVLVPIMLTSNTNLFFERSNISTLFKTMNDELIRINERFSTNKVSLDVEKPNVHCSTNQAEYIGSSLLYQR